MLSHCSNPLHSLQITDGPRSSSRSRGTSASSVRTQRSQIHQCDQYRNGLGLWASARRAARASGSRPCSDKTKRIWNSKGVGGSKLCFPCLILKNEISNKHGEKILSSAGRRKQVLWVWRWDSQATDGPCARTAGSSPPLQAATEGEGSRPDTAPTSRSSEPRGGRAGTALRTTQSNIPSYRWGN